MPYLFQVHCCYDANSEMIDWQG